MRNTRVFVVFLIRAVVVGLAVAFLVVWWNPTLLGARTTTPPLQPASLAATAPGARHAGRRHAGRRRVGQRRTGVAALPAATSGDPAPIIMTSFADAVAKAAPAVVNIYTARVITERTQATPLNQFFGDYWPKLSPPHRTQLGLGRHRRCQGDHRHQPTRHRPGRFHPRTTGRRPHCGGHRHRPGPGY